MRRVTITAKRQATLPREVCEELGVAPGDAVELERRTVNGEPLWVLHGRKPDWSWFAAARRYGARKSHRWSVGWAISSGTTFPIASSSPWARTSGTSHMAT